MGHSTIRYSTPHAGDQVFISPGCGVHGHGSFWALVISTAPALVEGSLYVRVCPVEDVDGDARVTCYYVKLSGLLVRKMS